MTAPGTGTAGAADDPRASVFGSVADAYDRLRPGYPDDAVAWLVPPAAADVVEIAAGTGKLTDSLVARGLRVTAVEPDPGMLAVLQRRHPAVVTHRAPAERLPLSGAVADAVVVAQAWHWFDAPAAWAEVRRVLRPGGTLGLISHVPVPVEPWERALADLDPLGPAHAHPDPVAPTELDGLPGIRFETAAFPWTRQIAPDDVAALYGTYSIYAVMAPAERRRRLAAVAALARAEADRRGTPTVPLNSVVLVMRTRPTG